MVPGSNRSDSANTLFWVNLFRLASAQIATESRAEQESAAVSESSLPPELDYQAALDTMFDAINRELGWAPEPIPVLPASPVSGSSVGS
jgi:hypothetical protein